jgi:lysylphosphatidylglycerol synthetase-like protein (DUF2156 family)
MTRHSLSSQNEREVRAALRRVQKEGYLLEQRRLSLNGAKRNFDAELKSLAFTDIFAE